MKVGILCSPDMMPDAAIKNPYDAEGKEQLEKLIPALDRYGVGLERINWHHSIHRAAEFEAMLPLFAWDYWDSRDEFVQTLFQIAKNCRVINSPSLIGWNTDKIYLAHLEKQGVKIVPSQMVDIVDEDTVASAFDFFGTDRLVAKPRIGGGGFGQFILHRHRKFDENVKQIGAAILQPFLQNIHLEGEITTVWFGGEFSHALRKLPNKGDYRVQSHFGGYEEPFTAPNIHLEAAYTVFAALPEPPLYARIDLLRGNDDVMKVGEVELVEPYFYFAMASCDADGNSGANLFAKKLVTLLRQ